MHSLILTVGRLTSQDDLEQAQRGNLDGLLDKFMNSGQCSKRYDFHFITPRKRVLNAFFEQAFKEDPYAVINAASNDQNFYYKPMYICKITIPKMVGYVISSFLVQIAISYVVYEKTYDLSLIVYPKIQAVVARSIPLIVNHVPISVIRLFNRVIDLKSNILELVPFFALCAFFLGRLNWVFYIYCLTIPQTIDGVSFSYALGLAIYAFNALSDFGKMIDAYVKLAEQNELLIEKAKAAKVWNDILVIR